MNTRTSVSALSLSRKNLLLVCGAALTLMLPGLTGCGSSNGSLATRTNAGTSATVQTPDSVTLDRQVAENQANTIKFEAMIADVEKHLQRNSDGTLSLNEQTSRAAGMSDETRQFALTAVDRTNGFIKSGVIVVDDHFQVHSPDATRRVWVDGWHWWGVTVAFDNSSTQALISALKGNNISVAVNLFKNAVDGNIVGIIIKLLSVAWGYTIEYVNNNGGHHGVNVNVTWTTFMWVTSR